MNRSPRFVPLRAKLALGFALFFMVAVGFTTFIYYQNARVQLQRDIRERLEDAVSIGALQVDAVAHSQLTDPSQEGGPIYLPLKKTLQGIRDAGTNIRFVYTMRQDAQGNIVFIVDAEESEEDVSHLGDIYDSASPWLIENFASIQAPVVEDEMYTDDWGTWLTGYAPFYTPDGQREGVLGMDISADYVLAQEKNLLVRALLIFLGSIFVGTLVGWILGSTLTASLSKLTEGAEKLSSGDLAFRVNINSNDEIAVLANAFNSTAEKLNGLVTGLEKRVEERTTALSHRTSQLQAATQVARRAAAIKDTTTLLNDAVRLIANLFGFYHAGIFLLDVNNEYAILHAASSEGGQRMLARGHRLRIGSQGIVGFAAAQKRSRVALDTGADAAYFDNPDLPLTHSEAALPLIVHERVIGVLDIQSEKPQAFSADDIETFQTLADQLALAIENARLFNEMNSAVQQLEQAATSRVHDAWSGIAQAGQTGYQYTPLGIQPIINQSALTSEAGKLKVPITLHNQKIGVIKVKRKDGSDNWDPREQAMLDEIAIQVGLALENARLLEDAQQRAGRERSISEISARIGSAHDVEAILRVTAQEIGKALGDSDVTVQIRGQELEGS
jgi:GAF domain-containing protein/HAMP domain-containing protein